MAANPFDQFDSSAAANPFDQFDGAQAKPKGFGSDVATALKQGAQQLPGALTGLADIPLGLAGLNRPVSRAAEKLGEVTGFQPGKWAEQTAQQYSPETQAARADIDKAWEDPNAGALDVAGAYLRNPRATALNVVQSIPSIVAGGVAGRVVGGLAGLASAPARAAVGEGALIAGQSMDQIADTVDPQKAAAASLTAGAGGAAVGALGGAVAARAGVRDIDTTLAGGATARAARTPGVAARVATGGAQEAAEEAAQSSLEQGAQNWAEDKALTEGMARNAVEGALAGGVMGAGAGAIPPSRRMGLDPNAGPLSAAAATAVDSGAAPMLALPAPTVEVDADGTARTADQRQAEREVPGPVEAGAMGQGRNSEQVTPPVAPPPFPAPELQPALEYQAAPALGYDTAPTDTLIADQDGTVRPETRAEAINRGQVQQQERNAETAEAQRREELGLPPLTPVEPVRATAPRGETLDLGPDGVARPRDLLPQAVNRLQAGRAAREAGPGHEAVKVEGGWNVRRIEDATPARAANAPAAPGALPAPAAADPGMRPAPGRAAVAPPGTQQRNAPLSLPAPSTPIDQAAHAAATSPTNDLPEPTQAQKEAGNYKKGRLKLHGLDISIENPKGSTRTGTAPDGTTWARPMSDHYGYLRRTEGADGDQVDAYVGPKPESQKVFVVDQLDQQSGGFDEHKVLLGYDNRLQAARAYRSNFDRGWKVGPITELSVDQLKGWLKTGKTKEPVSEMQKAIAGDLERLYQADVKADIKARRGMAPTAAPAPRAKQSPLRSFLRQAGIDPALAADVTGERGLRANQRLPGTFRRGGMQLDALATLARERGFLTDADIESSGDTGGTRRLVEMIQAELRGERQESTDTADDAAAGRMASSVSAELESQASAIGFDTTGLTDEQVASAVSRIERRRNVARLRRQTFDAQAEAADERMAIQLDAEVEALDALDAAFGAGNNVSTKDAMRALGFTDQEIRDATANRTEGPSQGSAGRGGPDEPAAGAPQAGRGTRQGNPGGAPEEGLTSPTRADVEAQQDRAAQAARAKTAADQEADRRNRADAERGEFTLTGSDRPADLAAAAGQQDIFAAAPPPAPSPAPAPAAKIDDAGEKIGGARKDRWKDRGLDIGDLDSMSESEGAELAVKANVWKPDYSAMVDSGAKPQHAALVKVIYDRLAAKPSSNTPAGRRQYVTMMQAVRAAFGSLDGTQDPKVAVNEAREAMLRTLGVRSAIPAEASKAKQTLFAVYKGRSDPFAIDYMDVRKAEKMVAEGFPGKVEPWTRRLSIRERRGGAGLTPRGLELTAEDAKKVGTPLSDEQIRAGWFEVNTKAGKTVAYLPTRDDAEAAAKSLYEREMKAGADGATEPARPHLDVIKRVGMPQHIERDVSAEDFVAHFGFRGIEFGNWSAQDERQRIVNMAYDGLMDLATIMGVPPKAMSLNGTMGMAFGARGTGRALAHYEPGKLVINMTKLRGGGSLAHEWAHALDHYFGELDRADAYTTSPRGASGWYSEEQYRGLPRKRMEKDATGKWVTIERTRLENLRPEVARAFDNVLSTLFNAQETKAQMIRSLELQIERTETLAAQEADAGVRASYQRSIESQRDNLEEAKRDPDDRLYPKGRSQYAQQAQALSGKAVNGYWVRPTEMFARAFESWAFDKVVAMGARSDYLVHGVEADRFASGYKGNPYPTGEERALINSAFDKLAATIKTRETDKGTALFSRGPAGRHVAIEELAKKTAAAWANGPEVIVARSIDDPVLPERIREVEASQRSQGAEGSPRGVFYRGKVYLIADQIGSEKEAVEVLFHEALGHYGLRGVFGPALFPVLDQIATMRRADVQAKAAEYGLDLSDPKQRRLAAEEVLAEMAQTRPEVGWVKRAVAAIRTWLRENVPGFKDLRLTDAEIVRNFLEPARGFVERGRQAAKQPSAREAVPAASRGTTPGVANSKDVAGNTSGRPAGDNTEGERAAPPSSFKGSKVTDEQGNLKPVYHGTTADFKRFDIGERGTNTQASGAERGFFFAGDKSDSDLYVRIAQDRAKADPSRDDVPNGRILTAYLNVQNPLVLTPFEEANVDEDTVQELIDSDPAALDYAKDNGYDGVIWPHGNMNNSAYTAVVFDPDQIWIAPNESPAPNSDGAPMFSRTATAGAAMGTLTPAQEAAWKNVAQLRQEEALKERFDGLRANLGTKLRQGVLDQFAPIKEISQDAYMKARLSKGSDGTMEAALLYGKPFLRDGVPDVNVKDGGFGQVLAGLKGEHDRFLMWVAAQRAERLKSEGKENLFSDADISELKSLNAGSFADGSARTPAYAKALRDLNAFNDSVLAMAEESGLIDPAARALFKDQPYVPFYRVMEEGDMKGPKFSSGLVNQQAFKKLKGGKNQLNADLLENMLLNWSHLYSAAARNRAAVATMDAASPMAVAYQVPEGTKGAIRVMRAGNAEHWAVEDPYLLDAISALHYAPSPLMKPLAKMKNILTYTVTVNPTFKIRNLIRDSLSAISQADLSYNPLANVAQGWKATAKDSQIYASMLASGGTIRFGTQEDSARLRKQVEKLGGQVLDKEGWAKLADQVRTVWGVYEEFGDRTENVNRAALYEQLIAKGKTHAEASFMARDLMDFSMSGRWEVIRFLGQTVPFFNARLQGLYKLGRAAAEDPRRFGTMAAAVAVASLGLMMAYQDDDDWKKREDWDRDAYWWFKIGGTAFRVPKPFELGAIGTVAERTAELMFDKEMTNQRFGKRIADMVFGTFAMDPTPQIVKPLLDVYANKDSFTGRAIEGMSDERLRPQDRAGERTTEVARFLGQLGLPDPLKLAKGDYSALSPKQIDFLLRGYFGWVGTTAAQLGDRAVRPLMDRGERPAMELRNAFVVGNFAESLPSGSSRYVTQLYERAKDIDQAYASYRDALKRGDTDKAAEIREEEGSKLQARRAVENAKTALAKINQQARMVEASRSMSAEEKRQRLDDIEDRRDRIARLVP